MALPTTKKEVSGDLITAENQLQTIQAWGTAFDDLMDAQNVALTQAEKEFGMSIITNLSDRCIAGEIKAKELNMTNFLEQVKHYSKLQLSINENELFLDIRKMKDSNMRSVKISRQYQGIEKLMIRYSTKKIVRFKRGIVCKGDEFETVEDFDLGLTRIVKHNLAKDVDRNNLYNIEKAYDIAYVEEYGKLVPYTVIIDKNRIYRAKNAATTDKVWASDTVKMVLKTVAWELWNYMKPFIQLPIGMQESLNATEDDMDWTKPNIIDETNISHNVDFGDCKEKEKRVDVVEHEVVIEEPSVEQVDTEDEDGVEYLDYAFYKEHISEYSRCAYPDGRNAYDKETGKIRVKRK